MINDSQHRSSKFSRNNHYRYGFSGRSLRPKKSVEVSKLTGVTLIALVLLSGALLQTPHGLSQSDAVNAASNWLISHQLSDGSYGGFSEGQTASAAYGLWIKYGNSAHVLLSYNWLRNQLQNTTTTWFWGGGGNIPEADIPGEILYSFVQTQNLRMLNLLSSVAGNLTKFQQSNGGFLGYFDSASNKQVASSVDTAMALLGLVGSNSISSMRKQSAVNYLMTLQNSDGSFNLTSTVRSNSLYSLGPEPISATALVTLALTSASVSSIDPHITAAFKYLINAVSSNFNGHVYASSLSLLVFQNFSDLNDVNKADSFILQQQNTDGGFRDIIRGSTGSNALDTGWALIALQLGGLPCCNGAGGGRAFLL